MLVRPSGNYVYTLKTVISKDVIAKICSKSPLYCGDQLTFRGNIFKVLHVQDGALLVSTAGFAYPVSLIED